MPSRMRLFRTAGLLALVGHTAASVAADLQVEYAIHNPVLFEKAPFIARVVVRNPGPDAVNTPFEKGNEAILLERTSAVLRGPDGIQHALRFWPAQFTHRVGPGKTFPLGSGDSRVIERVFATVRQIASGERDFLPAGRYAGWFEVDLGDGSRIRSTEFAMTIRTAQGADRDASDLVTPQMCGFFEGWDAPPDETPYFKDDGTPGGAPSRYRQLQRIIDRYPESTYAQWIRFWKLYHHGSAEEALDYARGHTDFPLSDNLMARTAERLLTEGEYVKCREVVNELTERFPASDTESRAAKLLEALSGKR